MKYCSFEALACRVIGDMQKVGQLDDGHYIVNERTVLSKMIGSDSFYKFMNRFDTYLFAELSREWQVTIPRWYTFRHLLLARRLNGLRTQEDEMNLRQMFTVVRTATRHVRRYGVLPAPVKRSLWRRLHDRWYWLRRRWLPTSA